MLAQAVKPLVRLVDASQFPRRLLDQPGDGGRLGEVSAAVGNAYAVRRGNLLAQLLDVGGFAETVEHDVGSRASELARNPEPNPAGRTGNNSNLALQHGDPLWHEASADALLRLHVKLLVSQRTRYCVVAGDSMKSLIAPEPI